jgi:RNA polymerase sigma-70 factor (ECF subfamily)
LTRTHESDRPEWLRKALERLILDFRIGFFLFSEGLSTEKKSFVWAISPETILIGFCLNSVTLLMFSAFGQENDEDREMVGRCLRGSREAFDILVEKYHRKIYNLAYRFVGDPEEANDLAQEIFLAAYQNLKKFRGDAKFSTWLFQIATNRGKNRFKYLKRRGFFAHRGAANSDDEKDLLQREIPDHAPGPEAQLAGKQVQQIVQNAINELEPDHKEIVILRDIEGFSYDEIARILNLPEGTTKSRLHRARMVVKEKLKKVLS